MANYKYKYQGFPVPFETEILVSKRERKRKRKLQELNVRTCRTGAGDNKRSQYWAARFAENARIDALYVKKYGQPAYDALVARRVAHRAEVKQLMTRPASRTRPTQNDIAAQMEALLTRPKSSDSDW